MRGKGQLLAYKDWLILRYTVNSVNSMLVALNQFLSYLEMGGLKLKRLKVQRTDIRYINRELNKEEFQKKQIAKKAGVSPDKVFPHNLRHLFARTFYRETKNLLNLADLLGHSNLEVTRLYASQGLSEWKRNVERVNLLEKTT